VEGGGEVGELVLVPGDEMHLEARERGQEGRKDEEK
jgi:hypothetical protein